MQTYMYIWKLWSLLVYNAFGNPFTVFKPTAESDLENTRSYFSVLFFLEWYEMDWTWKSQQRHVCAASQRVTATVKTIKDKP